MVKQLLFPRVNQSVYWLSLLLHVSRTSCLNYPEKLLGILEVWSLTISCTWFTEFKTQPHPLFISLINIIGHVISNFSEWLIIGPFLQNHQKYKANRKMKNRAPREPGGYIVKVPKLIVWTMAGVVTFCVLTFAV